MSDQDNINGQIRRLFTEFEVAPKSSSFDSIMEKIKKKRRRRLFIIFFFGILVLTSGTFYFSDLIFSATQLNSEQKILSDFKNTNTKKSSKRNKKFRAVKKIVDVPSESIANIKTQPVSKIQKKLNFIKESALTIPNASAIKKIPAIKSQSYPSTVLVDSSSHEKTMHEIITDSKENSILQDSISTYNKPFVFLESKHFIFGDSVSEKKDSLMQRLTMPPSQNINALLKKKNSFEFLVGVSITPQLGSSILSENKNQSSILNNRTSLNFDAEPYSSLYLKNRKSQNTFRFNYSYSIKLGVTINDKWEIWLAGGQERFGYHENFYLLNSTFRPQTNPVYSTTSNSSTFSSLSNTPGQAVYNSCNYLFYSLECNKIIHPLRTLRLKFGVGLNVNVLRSATYAYVSAPDVYYFNDHKTPFLSETLYTLHLNGGMIKDLGKRLQLRLSPGIFYSPSSLFNNSYLIKQKRYGLQLEAMLAFKLF